MKIGTFSNKSSGGSTRGRQLLNVKVRATTARRKRVLMVSRLSLILVVIALLGGSAWFGVNKVLDKLFFSNPAYNLRELAVDLDGVMTGEDLINETGIAVGENIFCIDLVETDRKLRAIPMVADVSIERILPDKVKIILTARQPVAWVSPLTDSASAYDPQGMLLADSTGRLLKPMLILNEYHKLPIIFGVKTTEILNGEALHMDDLKKALTLLAVARQSPASLLVIRSLNIAKGYCIDAITDQNSRIKFASGDFNDQLDKLQRLLEHCRDTGRELESVNLMVRKNTPVKFVMASATASTAASLQADKNKSNQPKPKGKKN
jgi:cell division protein FtsQ